MKSFKEFIIEDIETCKINSQKQLDDLEKFADRLLNKYGIDIEFTRHFGERIGDTRNKPCIKIAELQAIFKKLERNKGSKIKDHGEGQAVLVDIQKDLNLPVVIDMMKDGEFEVRIKTIMRKKNFSTPDEKLTVESKTD